MNKEETLAKLADLKSKNYPKMGIADFNSRIIEKLTDEQKQELDAYLNRFYKPSDERGNDCLWCNSRGIEWGLMHGSAHCIKCGWEYRSYHYLKDIITGYTGNERLEITLQYHPECFGINDDESEDGDE